MTRCILILLINICGIFCAYAKSQADHASIISQNKHHDNTGNEIESTQISMMSLGVMEGNDVLTDHFDAGNKHLQYGYNSLKIYGKKNFTSDNINLLTFIRKDIHFLGVLLI